MSDRKLRFIRIDQSGNYLFADIVDEMILSIEPRNMDSSEVWHFVAGQHYNGCSDDQGFWRFETQ